MLPPASPPALTPPVGNPRFPALDAVRGIAALMVVLFHAAGASGGVVLGGAFQHLDVGVTVFFVLSGFLLYRPMLAANLGLAPATSTGRYYWRRFLRIAPGYWVALLVVSPIVAFAGGGLINAALLQVYDTDWFLTGIGAAWSLCVEVAFYLALPLYAAAAHRLLRGSRRRRRNELLLLTAAALAAMALREYLLRADTGNPYALLLPPAVFPWFAIGMALAVASTKPWRVRLSAPLCWGAALAVYGVTLTTHEAGSIGRITFACYGVIAALIVAPLVFGPSRAGRFLQRPALAWLGLVSFGIYLYHQPLMKLIGDHMTGHGLSRALLMFGVLFPAVLLGAASYYLVERPALRLKDVRSCGHESFRRAPQWSKSAVDDHV